MRIFLFLIWAKKPISSVYIVMPNSRGKNKVNISSQGLIENTVQRSSYTNKPSFRKSDSNTPIISPYPLCPRQQHPLSTLRINTPARYRVNHLRTRTRPRPGSKNLTPLPRSGTHSKTPSSTSSSSPLLSFPSAPHGDPQGEVQDRSSR